MLAVGYKFDCLLHFVLDLVCYKKAYWVTGACVFIAAYWSEYWLFFSFLKLYLDLMLQ